MVIIVFSSFAHDLFTKGDYYRAITEYKREIFLGIDTINAMYMLAKCYKNIGEYEKSLYWFGRLNFIDRKFEDEYKYLLGITLNIEDLKLMVEDDEKELIKIISKYEKTSKKIYFSYLIPGSSQILFGNYRDGIFSFIWNAISFYNLYLKIKERDYLGIIFSLPLFYKFYTGNIEMTKRIERENAYRRFKEELEEYYNH